MEQVFYEPSADPAHPRGELWHPVDAVEKFPADLEGNGIIFVAGCAQVVLEDLALIEPTSGDARQARAAADRGRRTLTIIGPAECFGAVVPYRGERIRVDLDDGRLNASGTLAPFGGTVVGTVTQVGRVVTGDVIGVAIPVPIEPGTSTADLLADLLVVLVVDELDDPQM